MWRGHQVGKRTRSRTTIPLDISTIKAEQQAWLIIL
jgi:hypothetical protein